MSVDQYNLGYAEFKSQGELSNEAIKAQHPVWRAGYRAALLDHQKKQNIHIPLELYEVQAKTHVYTPTWDDIMAASKRYRYRKLHKDHMYPLLSMMVREVEKHKDEIHSYSQVREMFDKAFEIVLQYGYDLGILNKRDLKQYDFIPK